MRRANSLIRCCFSTKSRTDCMCACSDIRKNTAVWACLLTINNTQPKLCRFLCVFRYCRINSSVLLIFINFWKSFFNHFVETAAALVACGLFCLTTNPMRAFQPLSNGLHRAPVTSYARGLCFSNSPIIIQIIPTMFERGNLNIYTNFDICEISATAGGKIRSVCQESYKTQNLIFNTLIGLYSLTKRIFEIKKRSGSLKSAKLEYFNCL